MADNEGAHDRSYGLGDLAAGKREEPRPLARRQKHRFYKLGPAFRS